MNPKELVGVKKANLSVVPPSAIIGLSEAMSDGAKKYGPFNWREQPVKVTPYYEAALRHLIAWFDGEDEAEDSKVDHLSHAMATICIIKDSKELGILIDDRPTKGPSPMMLKKLDKSK